MHAKRQCAAASEAREICLQSRSSASTRDSRTGLALASREAAMFRPIVSLILVLTLPCLVRAHADAAGPPDPNNGNIPLCTAAGAQFVSAIASDGAGGAIVAWLDVRDSAHNEIYVQRTSAAGVPQWTAKGLALTVGQQCVTPRL